MKYLKVQILKSAAQGQGYYYHYPSGFVSAGLTEHVYESFYAAKDAGAPEYLYCQAPDSYTVVTGIEELTEAEWQAAVDLIKGA